MADKSKNSGNRELPEKLEFDFVICDNTLNRKGWRLLVDGIDLTAFNANPICCFRHEVRDIPVGRWKNVRVEGEKLLGTVEFDRNDEFAVKLYWKYADGFMKACSLWIDPIEESDNASLLVPGQRYGTVTKSELLKMYNPYILKSSMINNRFDEDLYQSLICVFLKCISSFPI